jgi:hypothetical protein
VKILQRTLLAAILTLGAATSLRVDAQPASSAAPSAGAAGKKAPATERGKASKPADTAPDAGAPESDAGALPPGHPRVDEGLPAGHPPVEGPSAQPARPVNPGFFQAPPDGAEEDQALPPGVLVVTVRDAEDKPLPRAPIRLEILHSTVAKGDSREHRDAEADDNGSARFDGLTIGSGTTYRVVTRQGPATFAAPPFPLGDKAGKRAVVHSYESATDIDDVFVGMRGFLFLALRDDSILIEQALNVFNLGPVAWVPEVKIPLPEGYKALNKEESGDEMRLDDIHDFGVALRGTIAPGRHDVSYRYQVPLDRRERQTIEIELPPRVAQMRVIAEASKTMKLKVEGFPAAQQTQLQNGTKVLVTEQVATRDTGGFTRLTITLDGLPTPPPGRLVALGIALLAVVGALAYSFRRPAEDQAPDEDAQRELQEARDALLEEFVELERARKRGDVGPKTYSRVRAALLDALARIVARIEEAPAPAPQAKRKRAIDGYKVGGANQKPTPAKVARRRAGGKSSAATAPRGGRS